MNPVTPTLRRVSFLFSFSLSLFPIHRLIWFVIPFVIDNPNNTQYDSIEKYDFVNTSSSIQTRQTVCDIKVRQCNAQLRKYGECQTHSRCSRRYTTSGQAKRISFKPSRKWSEETASGEKKEEKETHARISFFFDRSQEQQERGQYIVMTERQ